jgi:hypothetical protein
MRCDGNSNVYVGAYFSFCAEQQQEYLRDGRKRGETYDAEAYAAYLRKHPMTPEKDDEANERQEVVFFMDGDKRAAKKNYLNVKASRLVAKAEENIRGVEEKRFPVGTPKRLVVGKSSEKKS